MKSLISKFLELLRTECKAQHRHNYFTHIKPELQPDMGHFTFYVFRSNPVKKKT